VGVHVGPVAKKKRSSSEKDLKADVKELTSRAEKAEARADRWKLRAGRYEKDAAELRAELRKVSKRLDKAQRTAPPVTSLVEQPSQAPQPDATWTVGRLRAEARARGLNGVTSRSKAQLLDLLKT
jgi:chromosome segregation ATPase